MGTHAFGLIELLGLAGTANGRVPLWVEVVVVIVLVIISVARKSGVARKSHGPEIREGGLLRSLFFTTVGGAIGLLAFWILRPIFLQIGPALAEWHTEVLFGQEWFAADGQGTKITCVALGAFCGLGLSMAIGYFTARKANRAGSPKYGRAAHF